MTVEAVVSEKLCFGEDHSEGAAVPGDGFLILARMGARRHYGGTSR